MLEKVLSKNIHGQEAWFFHRPDTNDLEIINDTRLMNGYFSYGMGAFEPGDIVIDIGGHIGSYAIECAIRGKANVISFEPEPENYHILTRNIDANKLKKYIIARNKGVSIDGKNSYLYIDETNPGSHSMIEDQVDHNTNKRIEIETITLDTITRDLPKVKLLKLDCEGLEYDILMWSDLSKVERIVAELHDRDKTPDLMKYLMVKGFFVKWHYGKRLGFLQAKR